MSLLLEELGKFFPFTLCSKRNKELLHFLLQVLKIIKLEFLISHLNDLRISHLFEFLDLFLRINLSLFDLN